MASMLNRARMTTATTGTGTITLGAADTGYLSFAEAGAANATVYAYVIEDGDDFEIGEGTYTASGTTFSRDTVTASKISGTAGTSKISLSGTAKITAIVRVAELTDNIPVSRLNSGSGASAATFWRGDATWASPLTRGTAVASTSGSEVDFTSLPSGIKRITIMFDGVSLSGTDELAVQIGDSGGFETTGYSSAAIGTSSGGNGIITSTTAFCARSGNASRAMSGMMVLANITGNVWVENHVLGSEAQTSVSYGGGTKTLSGTLDRVRITRNGTNTFDAGQINILYE